MICEKILAKIHEMDLTGKQVEYVEIEWDEAFKKIHKKVTDQGREVGIRLSDTVLKRGIYEGDVIYADHDLIIGVKMKPCEVIRIRIAADHSFMAAKVCYEIGNRHAPLFYGVDEMEFITLYNEPMEQMLSGMHGVTVERKVEKLDFEHRVSAAVHHHQH